MEIEKYIVKERNRLDLVRPGLIVIRTNHRGDLETGSLGIVPYVAEPYTEDRFAVVSTSCYDQFGMPERHWHMSMRWYNYIGAPSDMNFFPTTLTIEEFKRMGGND